MTDLYLIAHKVSGEPAFDIATRMVCPMCDHGTMSVETDCGWEVWPCGECDNTGFWWIIPTSGHRAYPWWSHPILACGIEYLSHSNSWAYGAEQVTNTYQGEIPSMPPTLPDHYHHSASPSEVRDRLASLIASLPPAPKVPFKRRF